MAVNYKKTGIITNKITDLGAQFPLYGTKSSAEKKAQTPIYGTTYSYTPSPYLNSNQSTMTLNPKKLDDIDFNDLLDMYNNTYKSGGGGGGMIDISKILAAYDQEAQSNRDAAKQQYDTTRNDLLTSLKRFQEQNAKDVENQQRTYLSNQASLESAISQANRQNRISAAARGLGGSGLQQLAQLQNLLNQGQNISDLATNNQSAMDALRLALAREQEDYDTKLSNAEKTYTNTISAINSALAKNKAQTEYQAREQAAARAAQAAASASAQAAANRGLAQEASQVLAASQEKLQNALTAVNIASDKMVKNMKNPYTGDTYGTKDKNAIKQALYDAARQDARNTLSTYQIGTKSKTSETFLNNLLSVYQNSNR